ncbi:MAG: hypothetical protein Q4C79_07000 [Neisseria sp.]|uniref:hypothetical protein n=1 Tax=Neisseria sp. TaxID=192066 RepID=UPI0026DB0481|nr:hypothetical protein [Neisseria sp.]MDO4248692.1 hypothetical protein [Neisseria sp.]
MQTNYYDLAINGVQLNDAVKNGDDAGMVAATVGVINAAGVPRSVALGLSLGAVKASVTVLADKVVNNKGVTLSDVMAAQAAVGSFMGTAASYAGDGIQATSKNAQTKAIGVAAEVVGGAVNKASAGYAAAAFTMSKTKVDLAVWDPQNKTGLPKITDFDGSKETAGKIGDILQDNAASTFNDAMNDFGKWAQDNDQAFTQGLNDVGAAVLPKILELSGLLRDIADPAVWEEKAQALDENIDQKFQDVRKWLEEKFLPFAFDLGESIRKLYEDIEDPWCTPDDWREWQEANRDGKFHIDKDPLVLDLDGDGIETVQTNGYKGAMFDHNKDGIRTATGWVAADDGLLVIDKNGDGLINNGGELFGDNQVLKDGSTATTGYAALADYDSNDDKVIDSKDAQFADLRIWRDLNQDGISQSNEWFTLAQLNIQSLDLEHQNVDKHLGNGKDNTKNACLKTLLVA